jgi:hypothetical protein
VPLRLTHTANEYVCLKIYIHALANYRATASGKGSRSKKRQPVTVGTSMSLTVTAEGLVR